MSSLRDSICVKSHPALPCRATDCPVPSGLTASGDLRFFSTPQSPIGFREKYLRGFKALIAETGYGPAIECCKNNVLIAGCAAERWPKPKGDGNSDAGAKALVLPCCARLVMP